MLSVPEILVGTNKYLFFWKKTVHKIQTMPTTKILKTERVVNSNQIPGEIRLCEHKLSETHILGLIDTVEARRQFNDMV